MSRRVVTTCCEAGLIREPGRPGRSSKTPIWRPVFSVENCSTLGVFVTYAHDGRPTFGMPIAQAEDRRPREKAARALERFIKCSWVISLDDRRRDRPRAVPAVRPPVG